MRWAWGPLVWKDGVCLGDNFVVSHLMALDFDEANYTLASALRDWGDTVHIIGTTKSHQREKISGDGVKPPKDRFRVIVPWERPITSRAEYEYNVGRLISEYDADETCKDAARFFWPCREIVSVNLVGQLQPVRTYTPPERLPVNRARRDSLRSEIFRGAVPLWVADFVRRGKMPTFPKLQNSRKWACFAAAASLRDLDWSVADVANFLHDGKFDRHDFDPNEIDAAIKSAFKKGRK